MNTNSAISMALLMAHLRHGCPSEKIDFWSTPVNGHLGPAKLTRMTLRAHVRSGHSKV